MCHLYQHRARMPDQVCRLPVSSASLTSARLCKDGVIEFAASLAGLRCTRQDSSRAADSGPDLTIGINATCGRR
jgi:hypothetical protein